jgi:ATP-dependent DNA helicase MPH1
MSELEDEYGDIADEDFLEALSQPSQTLPPHPGKRQRVEVFNQDDDIHEQSRRRQRTSRDSGTDYSRGETEEENENSKKKRYMVHISNREVPPAQILGATQAEALPDSSPWRIRGPIYKKPRPEPPLRPPKPPIFSKAAQRLSRDTIVPRQASGPIVIDDDEFGLADLPSDAFSSQDEGAPEIKKAVFVRSSPVRLSQEGAPRKRLVAPQQGLRQTTLFGGRAPDEAVPASQIHKRHNFIGGLPPEAPTHHALDEEALKTWVYPTNLGKIRDYQFSIVRNGLFHNLLVALPTGLWTKDAQIVFVAPTKPLVAQQIDACFNIVGIPKSQTTMLTGEQVPALRAEEWLEKRVFFMTPQTLDNDLASGIADPKKIVLLVVDEAHRATGNYAYVKVVKFLRRFNKSFRILALTATPGATVEAVQEVIDGLEISKVEIRTEESIDIQQYVHRRNIDQILLDPSDEIILIKEHFTKALQPLVDKLCGLNAYYNKDPMALTPFGMMQARKTWFASAAGRSANMAVKGMANALFQILASIAHPIKLLNFHGISPFYSAVKEFRQGVEDANKAGKYRTMIVQSPDFKKMMDRIALWLSNDDFVGHPKLTYLCDTILNHFLDAGEGRLEEDAPPSATRVIVFSEFRDSAEDIARVLNKHGPMIRATVFVGQADSKRSEGMNQAKQLETIEKFKSGTFNVIVATSIGEEGLDIGQVDLIVCYDASGSPIRMLQRMGRTGRKRAGKIVLLLMKGKEEDSFAKAKDNYEQMQKMISDGSRFNFRHDLSVRILPKGANPTVDKRMIDIPLENTQDPSLPEPKRRPKNLKKKPAKKFHMPDGVQTGFTKASKLSSGGTTLTDVGFTVKPKKPKGSEIAPLIEPKSVLLNPMQEQELDGYLRVDYGGDDFVDVEMLDLTAQTAYQRSLAPAANVRHGEYTKRNVKLFRKLAESQLVEELHFMPYGSQEPSQDFLDPPVLVQSDSESEFEAIQKPPAKKSASKPAQKKKQPLKPSIDIFSFPSEAEESEHASSSRPRGRDREVSFSGDESEGQGDEIRSEARSEDSDTDVGSLKDFLASGDQSSQRSIIRSSTTPAPHSALESGSAFRNARLDVNDVTASSGLGSFKSSPLGCMSSLQVPVLIDDGEDGEEDEEDEDEEELSVPRHREKRRAVVDSDSDG